MLPTNPWTTGRPTVPSQRLAWRQTTSSPNLSSLISPSTPPFRQLTLRSRHSWCMLDAGGEGVRRTSEASRLNCMATADDLRDPRRCGEGFLMFPDANHQPARSSEANVRVSVPPLVGLDLLLPELGILPWPGPMNRTPMPKTAVD